MNAIPARRVAVVAELSANHHGNLQQALALVDAAARASAHAVKIQTWHPDLMVLDRAHVLERGPWAGKRLVDLYAEAHTPWEWHAPIFERAAERGIVGFTSVFDRESLDYLERHHRCPVYKVASFELVDLQLIQAIAKTGKPIILSAGMATRLEIEEAVAAARTAGALDITVLKCTSAYPAGPEAANLRTLRDIAERFGVRPGLSDHTTGVGVAIAAAALGAKVIEKHLKIHRDAGGLDGAFSIDPEGMALLVAGVEAAAVAPGDAVYGPTIAEGPQLELRRSLYLAKPVRAGETLTAQHIRTARPARGLSPRYLGRLIGRQALCDAPAGTPLTWGLIEPADAIAAASNN
jgi:N-acetylneuraminate synthase